MVDCVLCTLSLSLSLSFSYSLSLSPHPPLSLAAYEGVEEYSCKYFANRKDKLKLAGKQQGPLVRIHMHMHKRGAGYMSK